MMMANCLQHSGYYLTSIYLTKNAFCSKFFCKSEATIILNSAARDQKRDWVRAMGFVYAWSRMVC